MVWVVGLVGRVVAGSVVVDPATVVLVRPCAVVAGFAAADVVGAAVAVVTDTGAVVVVAGAVIAAAPALAFVVVWAAEPGVGGVDTDTPGVLALPARPG